MTSTSSDPLSRRADAESKQRNQRICRCPQRVTPQQSLAAEFRALLPLARILLPAPPQPRTAHASPKSAVRPEQESPPAKPCAATNPTAAPRKAFLHCQRKTIPPVGNHRVFTAKIKSPSPNAISGITNKKRGRPRHHAVHPTDRNVPRSTPPMATRCTTPAASK